MLLPTIVAKLEREETKAELIFKKLRSRFPHNAAVMRHYALFLEEVKSEPELAYGLFKQGKIIVSAVRQGRRKGTGDFEARC